MNLVLLKHTFYSRIKNIARAVLKKPERIDVPVNTFLHSIGGNKIKNFIKIGSNDGLKNDPFGEMILQFNWNGIMVEPFEPNYKKLRENFGNQQNLVLENAGISDSNGFFDFYFITDITADEPDWYDQVGSFNKETFVKNIEVEKKLLSRIGIKKIECITFDDLVKKHHFTSVDLIHLDTEGYDWKILRTIDINRYKPKVILFEIEWLTHYEIREARQHLIKNGYKLYYDGNDCIAVKSA